MTRGELKRAKRLAMTLFDEWIEVTGLIENNSSYYYELESIIEDAVDIGARMATETKIDLDDYRNEGSL